MKEWRSDKLCFSGIDGPNYKSHKTRKKKRGQKNEFMSYHYRKHAIDGEGGRSESIQYTPN